MKTSQEFKKEQSKILNLLFKDEKWDEARKLLFKLLKQEPNDHWLLANIAETYHFDKKIKQSEKYIELALEIAPYCPIVLWDQARILDRQKKYNEANKIFKNLIKRGINRIAFEECGEGIREARKLVNDCRYRVGLIYANKGEYRLAIKYITAHIQKRNRNCPSIYNLREVKKDLKLVIEGKDPRS